MSFITVSYLLFVPVVALLYYLLPKKLQNPILLAASLFFYCSNLKFGTDSNHEPIPLWKSLLPLAVLAGTILFLFFAARALDKLAGAKRKRLFFFSVAVCVLVLAFFKYNGFVLPTLFGSTLKLGLPLGISFFTFAGIGYLTDVYRKDIEAESSLLRLAVFIGFFGTITSGPICRAGKILPQLKKEHAFHYRRTTDALRMALIGYFKYIAVANVLGLFTNTVFESLHDYSGMILMLAVVLYALQLYFEFSGYSDIAMSSGAILDIELPVNFKTPYFSTNFSAFWSRWHISLSNWLNDYIFMPLIWGGWQTHLPVIGKKWQAPPMLTSLFILFFVSGFWHGNTWPFVVWGVLQAAYRIGEELLHRWRKPKKRPSRALRIFKTVCVFILWCVSLVFFRVGLIDGGTISDAFYLLGHQFSPAGLAGTVSSVVQAGFYAKPLMVAVYFAYLLLVLAISFGMDHHQCFAMKDRHISTAICNCRPAVRFLIYWCLVGLILVGFIMQSGGFGSVSFTYANF